MAQTHHPEMTSADAMLAEPFTGFADSDPIQRLASRVDALPALPAIATQLLDAVDNPETSASCLANLISADPALASRLLRLANSAFYGFPRRIGTVNLAIAVLGFEAVRDLCLSVIITDCFFNVDDDLPFDIESFWQHSLTSAVGCRMIYKLSGGANPGEGFIAGLIHDIGKMFLGRYFPQEYEDVLRRAQMENVPLLIAEEERFHVSHPVAGAWLLDCWNLPDWLVMAVRDHHRLTSPARQTSAPDAPIEREADGSRSAADAPGGKFTVPEKLALAVAFTDILVRRAHPELALPGVDAEVTAEMISTLRLKKDAYDTPDFSSYLDRLSREIHRSADIVDSIRTARGLGG
jgi:HD-like signal output (HDOD) protein